MIFKVGITAWGDQECNGNRADVFADVSKALGFIDWATKCLDGPNTNYFGLKGHERWAKRQYCQNKDRIEIIKNKVSYLFILEKYMMCSFNYFENCFNWTLQIFSLCYKHNLSKHDENVYTHTTNNNLISNN